MSATYKTKTFVFQQSKPNHEHGSSIRKPSFQFDKAKPAYKHKDFINSENSSSRSSIFHTFLSVRNSKFPYLPRLKTNTSSNSDTANTRRVEKSQADALSTSESRSSQPSASTTNTKQKPRSLPPELGSCARVRTPSRLGKQRNSSNASNKSQTGNRTSGNFVEMGILNAPTGMRMENRVKTKQKNGGLFDFQRS